MPRRVARIAASRPPPEAAIALDAAAAATAAAPATNTAPTTLPTTVSPLLPLLPEPAGPGADNSETNFILVEIGPAPALLLLLPLKLPEGAN